MKHTKIHEGDKFNFLKVLGLDEKRNKKELERYKNGELKGRPPLYYLCECVCGNKKSTIANNLTSGKIKSCGCKRGELRKRKNNYTFYKDYVEGDLKGTDKKFVIDLEDYDKIKDYTWILDKSGYVRTTITNKQGKSETYGIHNIITGTKKNIDHIDRNPLNNRKNNFRFATLSQNAHNKNLRSNNTSGVTGVSYNSSKNLWEATLIIKGKKKTLGSSRNKEIAIKKRLQAEKEFLGEFAPQKHLFKKYGIEEGG